MTPHPDAAIWVRDLALAYRRTRHPVRSVLHVPGQMISGRLRLERHWALQDVSFRVHRGEVLGVVGANGAGKSTLLKVLGGVLYPTRGSVVVNGSCAALIELGAGFEAEYTALENVMLYGTLLGADPEQLRERAPFIVAWAGLTDVADVPVREYSSGMLARLGFAIVTNVDPDVLLVDEILAVGDEDFQARSGERMRALIKRGSAVVLVSHATTTIAAMADRVLWLDHGRARACGHPESVIAAYRAHAGSGVEVLT
jgi:ABC-type polysaccharide/polyol phosphate transport system ATPase subunit